MIPTNQNSCCKARTIVCDFDGTITTHDLGGALARHFATADDKVVHQQFNQGEITLFELQNSTWPKMTISQTDIDQFMDAHVQIRPGLSDLLLHCHQQAIEFHIVSGGFDFYIPRVLTQHNLTLAPHWQVKTNRGVPSPTGMRVEFPHRHHSCDYCSNCKGHFIRELRALQPQTQIIGIGDGHSDHCMVEEADLVFACDYLAAYCQQQQLAYHPFETFTDILQQLKKLE